MENTDWKIEKMMSYIELLTHLHEAGMGDQSQKIAEVLEELHKKMGFGAGRRGIVVKSPDKKEVMLYSSGEIKEIEVKRLEE